jgi:hypothetical protein
VFASKDGCKKQCEVYEYIISIKRLIITLKENDKIRRKIIDDITRKKFEQIAEELLEKYGHYFEIITMNTKPAKRRYKRKSNVKNEQ